MIFRFFAHLFFRVHRNLSKRQVLHVFHPFFRIFTIFTTNPCVPLVNSHPKIHPFDNLPQKSADSLFALVYHACQKTLSFFIRIFFHPIFFSIKLPRFWNVTMDKVSGTNRRAEIWRWRLTRLNLGREENVVGFFRSKVRGPGVQDRWKKEEDTGVRMLFVALEGSKRNLINTFVLHRRI